MALLREEGGRDDEQFTRREVPGRGTQLTKGSSQRPCFIRLRARSIEVVPSGAAVGGQIPGNRGPIAARLET